MPIKKSRVIRRCGKTGEEHVTSKEEVYDDVFKNKRTNHNNTISLQPEELDRLRGGQYTAIRVTVLNTGETVIIRDIASLVAGAHRVAIKDEEGVFKCYSTFFVAKFR